MLTPSPEMSVQPQTVICIDDHSIVRAAIEFLVSREADLQFAGGAADRDSATKLIELRRPAVAVIDLVFPNESGFSLIQDLRIRFPELKFIIFTSLQESVCAERCLRLGARGFVNKNAAPDTLVTCIRRVLQGQTHYSEGLKEALISRVASGTNGYQFSPTEMLSTSEFTVFEMIGQGMTTQEIAKTLCRSVKTVETYRSRIKHKLGIANGTQLAQFAIRHLLTGSH